MNKKCDCYEIGHKLNRNSPKTEVKIGRKRITANTVIKNIKFVFINTTRKLKEVEILIL